MTDEEQEMDYLCPESNRGTPVSIMLYAEDVDGATPEARMKELFSQET